MYFIALQMLFGDRGKYLGMIVGITFAALIMTQQPAIMVGLLSRSYSFMDDVSLPDIWVMDPGVQYVEEHKPMRDTELARVRGIDGVAWAAPLYKNVVTVKLPDGRTMTLDLNGLDDATLLGAPTTMVEGSLHDLRRADGIIIEKVYADQHLQVKQPDGSMRKLKVGDELELNDHRAIVVGFSKTSYSFITLPKAFTTYSRAVSFAPSNRRVLTYVLVKAQEGANIKALATQISKRTGLAAYTTQEFKDVTLNYWMTNTGIPINFGISVTLGFLVGAAVAGQTFYNFVRENIKQYAALKAMGLRNGVLVRMVLLQALVVGVVGYGFGSGLTAIFGLNVGESVLAFRFIPQIMWLAALGVGLIVFSSALIAIRQVIKVDPAVVFRG